MSQDFLHRKSAVFYRKHNKRLPFSWLRPAWRHSRLVKHSFGRSTASSTIILMSEAFDDR